MYGDPIGYYIDCDQAICIDCVKAKWEDEETFFAYWKMQGGFESWAAPLVITEEEESDTPINCCDCTHLIRASLTNDGYIYVAVEIVEKFRGGSGNSDVLREWWEYYGEGYGKSQLRGIIESALN